MHISSFFLELRSAYQAELDDLTFDSEGRNVLRKRLTEKRQELGFLFQLMDLHPEMVAVVLHQAFTFTVPTVMDHFLTHHDDELLAWGKLKHALKIEVWAQPIVDQILLEPMGEWFMSVAAALEYMHSKPLSADNRPVVSQEDAEKLLSTQMAQSDKANRSDYIIHNDGDHIALEKQTLEVIKKIRSAN